MLTSIETLRFLLELILLLTVARGLGEIARKLGQPQVIGELLAGVVLGPSLFGWVLPSVYQSIFPNNEIQSLLIQVISELGVILLLLLSGIEVDIPLVKRKAKSAPIIAFGSLLVPFISGYGLAYIVPVSLIGQPSERPIFALFIATALSLSAIPVIVKILLDMDLMRRDIGQLTLATGIINDTVGWFLLSIVAGFATARVLPIESIAISIVGTLLYALFAFTLGYRMIRAFIRFVDDHFPHGNATLAAIFIMGLIGAAITQALHVEAFLGAFIIGVQLSRIPRVKRAAREQLETMTLGIFAPVFFAVAGLKVDLPALLTPELLLTLLAIILVASIGKFIGTYLGARSVGLPHWTAIALGSGMNARGAVEIIVATVGLQIGVLTISMYSMIVIMAVVTSIIAPPLLRWSLHRSPVDPQEEERLSQEGRKERSFLYGIQKMLVPIRDGRYAMMAAQVASHLAGERGMDATALHVRSSRDRTAQGATDTNTTITPTSTQVSWSMREISDADGVAKAILEEAKKDYDLLILGASARPSLTGLFGQVVDNIVQSAPCPTWVWRIPQQMTAIGDPQRILLPTTGVLGDRRVAELALAIARDTGATLIVLHVVNAYPLTDPFGVSVSDQIHWETAHAEAAMQFMEGLAQGVTVPIERKVMYSRGNAGDAITKFAIEQHCDMILLHAEQRFSGGELYCGNTVEQVLHVSDRPVAILFPPAVLL
ncbi:cation:proton antiporter [Sulfoacidibacillus ferrooxidans]|uniref:Glutathione-regulated potassium-efflux system protein KefB n=1 Tax=Sulfoacidibacillus ferrooxidans TaxID=2005001 RepID=A0A9X2ABV8_9BACL|nr:cation:proton antiporter [Sulfoacidibacillus ferrooxidans]MCI0183503.1 Glutathione-regulated potassium-efflux system protein KefB [Sulfoacidibacillus ferrooxidans]